MRPVRPPSVALDAGIKIAKSVNESGGDKVFDSLAFFFGEAGVSFVVFGASEVERSMGSVEIAADDDGLDGFEGLHEA